MKSLEGEDILILSDEKWGLAPSIRHKIAFMWERGGNRVLWVEHPTHYLGKTFWADLRTAREARLERVSKGIWYGTVPPNIPLAHSGLAVGRALKALHNRVYLPRIRHYLDRMREEHGFRPSLLVLFQQMAYRYDLIGQLPHEVSIYYNTDLFMYGHATAGQYEEERRCAERVDLIFTTSGLNQQRLGQYNPRVFHFAHAVDEVWWEQNRHVEPPEYASIPHPRVVFTGMISETVNMGLIRDVARFNPKVRFVILGPVIGRADRAGYEALRAEPNVHLLGFRPMAALPGFMAGADVLIFPYHPTQMMKYAGLATKFYEYGITGVPVLSTRFTEFESDDSRLFMLAETPEQWTQALAEILGGSEQVAERARELQRRAYENTYEERLQRQRRVLDEFRAGRGGGGRPGRDVQEKPRDP